MKIVEWNNAYKLGIPEIDEQHKALVDLISDIFDAVFNKKSAAECAPLIDALEKYTIKHFSEEENMMKSIKFPNFDEHKKLHELFIAKLKEEKDRNTRGERISVDVIHFLKDWLVNHILVKDKEYAKMYSGGGGFFKKFFKWFG